MLQFPLLPSFLRRREILLLWAHARFFFRFADLKIREIRSRNFNLRTPIFLFLVSQAKEYRTSLLNGVFFEGDDLSVATAAARYKLKKKASLYPRFALFKISPWICVKRDKKDIENEGDVGYVRCCIARRGEGEARTICVKRIWPKSISLLILEDMKKCGYKFFDIWFSLITAMLRETTTL